MNVLYSLLPFLILVGFWLFLMRNRPQEQRQPADAVVERLDAILEELARIRRELADRNF